MIKIVIRVKVRNFEVKKLIDKKSKNFEEKRWIGRRIAFNWFWAVKDRKLNIKWKNRGKEWGFTQIKKKEYKYSVDLDTY